MTTLVGYLLAFLLLGLPLFFPKIRRAYSWLGVLLLLIGLKLIFVGGSVALYMMAIGLLMVVIGALIPLFA